MNVSLKQTKRTPASEDYKKKYSNKGIVINSEHTVSLCMHLAFVCDESESLITSQNDLAALLQNHSLGVTGRTEPECLVRGRP